MLLKGNEYVCEYGTYRAMIFLLKDFTNSVVQVKRGTLIHPYIFKLEHSEHIHMEHFPKY